MASKRVNRRVVEADGSKSIGVRCCGQSFTTAVEALRHEVKHATNKVNWHINRAGTVGSIDLAAQWAAIVMSARPRTMTPAERFFWLNAGYSFDPKVETKAQGRRRCAVRLAEAEAAQRESGSTYAWQDDWGANHTKEFGYEPKTCESVTLWSSDGNSVLASLSCIDDATEEYRRVVEAELADEAGFGRRGS